MPTISVNRLSSTPARLGTSDSRPLRSDTVFERRRRPEVQLRVPEIGPARSRGADCVILRLDESFHKFYTPCRRVLPSGFRPSLR
jgi:hypothetical protein